MMIRITCALCAALLLAGCGDDDEQPTQSKAEQLEGSWYLEATEGDGPVASLATVSWTFESTGDVRQRVGGPFLQALRELAVVQDALAGEDLGDAERIDGANLNWIGAWALQGDSLAVTFDLLVVEVFGDVPILGKVTLPVFEQDLPVHDLAELRFACELSGSVLTLRGDRVAVGVQAAGDAEDLAPAVDGAAGTVAQNAVQLLTEQLQGLDVQRYVRR